MARVTSFAMLVFTLVPAVAPLIGAGIIWLTGWRGIFLAFIAFSLISTGWLGLRQPESLHPEHRRPFRMSAIRSGIAEVFRNRRAVHVIGVLSLAFGVLFTTLSTAQLVFVQTFDRGPAFPYWFGVISLLAGTSNLINARVVIWLGMRRVITLAFAVQAGCSATMAVMVFLAPPDLIYFAIYIVWMVTLFALAGFAIGNLHALGLEPLGHLTGLAASIIASVATVAAVVIAIPIGLAFDGTPLPIAIGIGLCSLAALWLMRRLGPED